MAKKALNRIQVSLANDLSCRTGRWLIPKWSVQSKFLRAETSGGSRVGCVRSNVTRLITEASTARGEEVGSLGLAFVCNTSRLGLENSRVHRPFEMLGLSRELFPTVPYRVAVAKTPEDRHSCLPILRRLQCGHARMPAPRSQWGNPTIWSRQSNRFDCDFGRHGNSTSSHGHGMPTAQRSKAGPCPPLQVCDYNDRESWAEPAPRDLNDGEMTKRTQFFSRDETSQGLHFQTFTIFDEVKNETEISRSEPKIKPFDSEPSSNDGVIPRDPNPTADPCDLSKMAGLISDSGVCGSFEFLENLSVLILDGMGPAHRHHIAFAAVNAAGSEYRTRANRKPSTVTTPESVMSDWQMRSGART